MMNDAELLRRYAETREESLFTALVQRHIDLVHSAALRQVNGDAHLAADVAQLVFTDLARKAGALAEHRVLAGWLFTSTRFAAAKIVRTEQRRRSREKEADFMRETNDDAGAALDWERVRPVLDEALAQLNETEREAILLRFFEERDFADVGAQLSLSANAARMRVERALEKLHGLLARRGVTSTTAALAAALGANAVIAAPAGLALSISGAALAGGAMAAGAGATFMSMTKLQLGLAAALAAGGATAFVVEAGTTADLRREVASLRQEEMNMGAWRAENLRLARVAAEMEGLRRDDAEFARLQGEAAELQTRLKTLAAMQAEKERTRAAAQADANRLDVSQLDQLPQPLQQARPQYPAELGPLGIEGKVLLEFVVDAEGRVQNAVVVESSRPEFELPALDAITRWRFKPGQKGGRPVNTKISVPIRFALKEPAQTGGMQIQDTEAKVK